MTVLREQIIKRFTRSSGWSKLRKRIVSSRGKCAVCGKTKGLEGHHIKPFRLFPELELVVSNIVVLCRRHHFSIGHLEYWKSYNTQLHESIAYFKRMLKGRP